MSDGTRSVVVERRIGHPAEKIWRALTQPHLIADWLMENDFALAPGHRFTLRRNPAPGVNVVIDCEVLEIDPNRTLSYRWAAYGLDSTVTFTLTPMADGTLLRVEQAGFPVAQNAAFNGASAAWPGFLGQLDTLLARID